MNQTIKLSHGRISENLFFATLLALLALTAVSAVAGPMAPIFRV